MLLSKARKHVVWKLGSVSHSMQRSLATNIDASAPREMFDILIVGGGIVGSSLACKLKSNPLSAAKKIGIIETTIPQPSSQENPDVRAYTISPGSQELLAACGAWQGIPAEQVARFKKMQVWDAMGDGFIRFNSKTIERDELGFVVEDSVLHTALYQRCMELADATKSSSPLRMFCPNKVKHFHAPYEDTPVSEVILDDGTKLGALLLVAADGGASLIRSLSALGSWGWEYDQKAVVATVKTNEVNSTAWQRFFPTGPLAVLPMRGGYSSIVWSCSPDMANELIQLSPDAFLQKLNAALLAPPTPAPRSFPNLPFVSNVVEGMENAAKTVLAAVSALDTFQNPPRVVEVSSQRVAFPLKMMHAIQYTRKGVVLVGDSAHTIHPLAGQGLNLGFADVESLGNILLRGIENGQSMSDELLLNEYEQERKKANVGMALAMDGFKRLFGPNPDFVGVARNVGMGTLNVMEPLKNKVMKYAMGISP